MTKHILDFSYAFTGRLAAPKASSPESLWKPFVHEEQAMELARRLHEEVHRGSLPFLDLSFLDSLAKALPETLAALPSAKHLVLLGVGGSSLGAKALQKAFAPGQDRPGYQGPYLWVADNIDALSLDSWLERLDPADTLVAVVSKSGGTIETMAQYFIIKGWLVKNLESRWTRHVIAITDPSKGALRREAEDCGLASLPVPDKLGGRYSVMSAVGMVPAAFMGMDWRGFLRGLKEMTHALASPELADNPRLLTEHPAFSLAAWAYGLMAHDYDQLVFFNYIPLWSEVGQWFAQLWAESLGKEGKGSMPIPAVGVSDQHSLQQMFLDGKRNKGCLFIRAPHLPSGPIFGETVLEGWEYLKGQAFGDLLQAEALGTRLAMGSSHIPLVECIMGSTDEEACGRFMGLLMATTLLTGWMLDIDPLDQPAVEFGKRLANAKLGAPGYDEEKSMLEKRSQASLADSTCHF